MDPDAALREIRELVAQDGLTAHDVARLCELVDGLDGWLSTGGYLPEGWMAHVRR